MPEPARLLVLAPNWLGDAVMALPAIADVRRRFPAARVIVAARRAVADLFQLVPGVDEILTLQWGGRWQQRSALAGDAARLHQAGADVAILLPNSFGSAWLARQAGVRERWGYRADIRGWLLSRAIRRPRRSLHQGAYYQHLTRALGIESGPLEPVVVVPEHAIVAARQRLRERGWDGTGPVAVFAPGAAYGTAKRWIPEYVARVISGLASDRRAACVLVGSRADAMTAALVTSGVESSAAHVIDLTGETTIEQLAGVLAVAQVCVSNDSGAMHLAAAVGTPLVAIFGPTREHETAPLTRAGRRAEVLTNPVWCRPCMLRECPIDHRCMTGITPDRVLAALAPMLEAR